MGGYAERRKRLRQVSSLETEIATRSVHNSCLLVGIKLSESRRAEQEQSYTFITEDILF